METSDLEALTLAAYRRWDKYADPAHNLQGLYPWEEEVLRDHFPAGGKILVAAAGGGREAIALARRGHAVTAFDCCPELIGRAAALAQQEGLSVDFRVAPPSRVATGLEVGYDAAILGWTGYSHIPDRARRKDFLQAMAGLLQPQGLLLLSFLRRAEDTRAFRWFHGVARIVSLLRPASRRPELGDTLCESFDRYFTDAELRAEIEAAGLEVLRLVSQPQAYAVARRPGVGCVLV
jgi:2-polyprenyl-3-methyl-5-hydroxy-6-metoxy-1,4-benzoquinol methylase